MQKLIEFNENQETPFYLPSQLDAPRHKADYCEVQDLDTQIRRHDNPHYWLQQDIVQIKSFRYRFFHNITLNDDTIPQVKVFRSNYQLLCEQQDQPAYVNFPQILTETELVPYIIRNEYRQIQYRNLFSFNTTYLAQINLDHNFITEHSETSDNRPYITTNVSPETTPEERTSNTLPQYIRQDTVQLQQDNITHFFQSQEPQQLNPLYPQLIQTFYEQPVNPSETTTAHPSETATTQNVSELSGETTPTVQNTQSFTIPNDSNLIQVPTHNITHDETNNQNQDDTLNKTQDNISVLSTSPTNVTQPSQTQTSPRQSYDPPPISHHFSTQINTHNSPQQGSSNVQHTNTVHFQTPTPPSAPNIQTSTYTPAQNNPVQNVQPGLNINTIHPNPPFNYTTSRQISRPPLQPISTNPLSYSLTSTNSSHTQHSDKQ